MNRQHGFLAMVALCLTFGACKRVEVIPESQLSLLPLAVGNEWIYVDSFITTTSLGTTDTTVSEIRYAVTRERALDHYEANGPDGKSMQRLQGWSVSNSAMRAPNLFLVHSDTLYTGQYYTFMFQVVGENCNTITGNLLSNVRGLNVNDGSMLAVMADQFNEADSLHFFPVFMDLPMCIPGLPPHDVVGVNYRTFFRPLVYSSVPVTVSTPAGTFTCKDFGSQYWAEGVGMIQGYQEAEASFYDADYQLQTGRVRWKRTLKSYHLE